MIILMTWYRRDQTPLNFQLAEVASVDKLHELSVVCSNSKCSIAPKLGYYKSLNYFLKAIKRSTKYQATHGHLMKEIKRVKHECEDIRKRVGKDINRQKVRDMADIALTQDESETIIKTLRSLMRPLTGKCGMRLRKCLRLKLWIRRKRCHLVIC